MLMHRLRCAYRCVWHCSMTSWYFIHFVSFNSSNQALLQVWLHFHLHQCLIAKGNFTIYSWAAKTSYTCPLMILIASGVQKFLYHWIGKNMQLHPGFLFQAENSSAQKFPWMYPDESYLFGFPQYSCLICEIGWCSVSRASIPTLLLKLWHIQNVNAFARRYFEPRCHG